MLGRQQETKSRPVSEPKPRLGVNDLVSLAFVIFQNLLPAALVFPKVAQTKGSRGKTYRTLLLEKHLL